MLGPLLFFLYINDFCKNVLSEEFMFADGTSLFKQIRNNMHHAASIINKDLEAMYDWCKQWLVIVNPTKTVYMLFTCKISSSQVPQYFMVISDSNRYSNTSTLASFLHQIYLGPNIYLQSLLKPISVLAFLKRTNISYPENL